MERGKGREKEEREKTTGRGKAGRLRAGGAKTERGRAAVGKGERRGE